MSLIIDDALIRCSYRVLTYFVDILQKILEDLIADKRIQPARIEEIVEKPAGCRQAHLRSWSKNNR